MRAHHHHRSPRDEQQVHGAEMCLGDLDLLISEGQSAKFMFRVQTGSRVQTRMGVLGRFSAPEGGQAAAKPPSRRRILG
jgi:hypothetical protein